MPTVVPPSLENVRAFRRKPENWADLSFLGKPDVLSLPDWSDDDWYLFLKYTDFLTIPAGEPLIRHGDLNSKLYFIVQGRFEVIPIQTDGISLGPLVQIKAGSVIGEQAFLDGGPRSANVWSTESSAVLSMSHQQFSDLESSNPKLTRDLVLSLARLLAIRLRRTTAQIAGND